MSQAILTLAGVRKSFDTTEIIRGVDLTLLDGERHAIIGPNGAGKSTLFHLISGQYAPSAGEIRLGNVAIQGRSAQEVNQLGLSRSFQITNVFPKLSVLENIRLGVLRRHGLQYNFWTPMTRLKQVQREVDELLERVRLTRQRDTFAGVLSYSEQRALEIGLTLASDPKVLILDEPMAGMSREETDYAVGLLRELTSGRSLLIVEHDMDVVFALSDRISVLVYGQIIATGTPEEVRADPAVQEAYLGQEELG